MADQSRARHAGTESTPYPPLRLFHSISQSNAKKETWVRHTSVPRESKVNGVVLGIDKMQAEVFEFLTEELRDGAKGSEGS